MDYITYRGKPEEWVFYGIIELYQKIFHTDDELVKDMEMKNELLTIVAVEDEKIVGFKMGYDRKEKQLYSWLGGVDEVFRGRGIASELMRQQHEWCRQNGYHSIRTHTKNKWKDILILNLRHGFDVIGTYTDGKGDPKIILEKRIQ